MQEEFLALIAEHKTLIYKVCHTFERDAELRRDLFQEILLNLWKAYPTYQPTAKWTTWAYRIALNVAITLRRKSQLPTAEYSELIGQKLTDAPYDTLPDERLSALHQAIAQLNTAEKALILLYLDDISYAEIAEIIGITENNVGVKINRIKSKIKQILSNYEYN